MMQTMNRSERSSDVTALTGTSGMGLAQFGPQDQNGVANLGTPKARKPRSPRKPDEEFKGFGRRMIRAYGRRAEQADPWVLGDLLSMQAEIELAVARAVRSYREQGVTWETIGAELTPPMNRVAAYKKFAPMIAALEAGEQVSA